MRASRRDLFACIRRLANAVPQLAAGILVLQASAAHGQSIEPRAYSNAPVGVSFLVLGYAETRGGVAFDSALPITDPDLETSSLVVGYARALNLWGNSGKFDIIVPYTSLSGTATYRGDPVEREVEGFGDPLLRLSVNLSGAPALTPAEFRSYRQDLIVGASLQVSVPAGQYDNTKLVNLGTNRWFFKPELGISKALGSWIFEGKAAVTLFTDNNDFLNGRKREQDPLYQLQGHAIYNFGPGVWGSLDATYFVGGRTTLDGIQNSDLQQNWRLGATLALPFDAHNSIKFYASTGVSARTGNSFDLLGVAWQYRWGAGL
ncbi:MAG: transporter [Betaproteobacteria bacterium]|nr:MAG: transporter [Betaproteobacteria bacterium]